VRQLAGASTHVAAGASEHAPRWACTPEQRGAAVGRGEHARRGRARGVVRQLAGASAHVARQPVGTSTHAARRSSACHGSRRVRARMQCGGGASGRGGTHTSRRQWRARGAVAGRGERARGVATGRAGVGHARRSSARRAVEQAARRVGTAAGRARGRRACAVEQRAAR
jgi:hypothetical protein